MCTTTAEDRAPLRPYQTCRSEGQKLRNRGVTSSTKLNENWIVVVACSVPTMEFGPAGQAVVRTFISLGVVLVWDPMLRPAVGTYEFLMAIYLHKNFTFLDIHSVNELVLTTNRGTTPSCAIAILY